MRVRSLGHHTHAHTHTHTHIHTHTHTSRCTNAHINNAEIEYILHIETQSYTHSGRK